MILRFTLTRLAFLVMQEPAAMVQQEPPKFTGEVQPKYQSSEDAPLTKLIFLAEPTNGEVKGREVPVDVKDGKFESKLPLPAGRLSVFTVPSCIPLETLTLNISGAGSTLQAGEASSVGTSMNASGWSVNLGNGLLRMQWRNDNQFTGRERNIGLSAGIPRLGALALGMRDRMGGVNIGCPKPREEAGKP